MLRLLIVEDNQLMLNSIVRWIASDFGDKIQIFKAPNLEQAYHILLGENKESNIDVAFLDLRLPPYEAQKLYSGEDLGYLIRNNFTEMKIIFFTSMLEFYFVERIIFHIRPEGFINKEADDVVNFSKIIRHVAEGGTYFCKSLDKYFPDKDKEPFLDKNDIAILRLLYEGKKTTDLHKYIPLTTSAIEKRKTKIKIALGIEKGNDVDMVREAINRKLLYTISSYW